MHEITIKINKIWKFKVVGCFKLKEKLVEAVHDCGLTTKNWGKVAGMSSSNFSYTKSKACRRNILEVLHSVVLSRKKQVGSR